nr:hypothetical protein [Tanacetum cinerariifolium]
MPGPEEPEQALLSPNYVPGLKEPEQASLSPDYVPGLEEPEQAPLLSDYVPGPKEPEQAPLSSNYVPGPKEPKQALPSPVYLPYVPELVYPEYMPPEDNGDLEEDDEEDPEEDLADCPIDSTVVALPVVDHVPSKESGGRESSAACAARQDEPAVVRDDPYSLLREELYGFVDRVDVVVGRPMSKELDYGITDTWDKLVGASEEIAPTTLQGVNQRVTDHSIIVEQETTIMGRPVHRHLAVMIEREARMAHEAWGLSMDASDNAHLDIMSLRTTLVAQHALILDLQAVDRRRQGVIKELLAADHKRQIQLTKVIRLLKRLQTQTIEFQKHHRPAKGRHSLMHKGDWYQFLDLVMCSYAMKPVKYHGLFPASRLYRSFFCLATQYRSFV